MILTRNILELGEQNLAEHLPASVRLSSPGLTKPVALEVFKRVVSGCIFNIEILLRMFTVFIANVTYERVGTILFGRVATILF